MAFRTVANSLRTVQAKRRNRIGRSGAIIQPRVQFCWPRPCRIPRNRMANRRILANTADVCLSCSTLSNSCLSIKPRGFIQKGIGNG